MRTKHCHKVGTGPRLYLYSDLRGNLAWAASLQEFRTLTRSRWGIRTAHMGWDPPPGYHKPNGELANDAVERL